MGKLTHLEAFCSDVAKRGRVWTDGTEEFMRAGKELWFRGTISRTAPWTRAGRQVAAMEGTVTWADEPKTLTPQEMVAAIGDILGDNGCDCDCECGSPPRECTHDVEQCLACKICDVIQPQFARAKPSQPAEPLSIYEARRQERRAAAGLGKAEPTKPPLKVGDRVKRGPDYPSGLPAHDHAGVVCKLHDDGSCLVSWYDGGVTYPCRYGLDGKYDIEKIEAEPQVEYPLTYAEAMWAMECGSHVSSERWPGNVYHKDYSFLAFDTDEVKSSWRIVEPATGGEG